MNKLKIVFTLISFITRSYCLSLLAAIKQGNVTHKGKFENFFTMKIFGFYAIKSPERRRFYAITCFDRKKLFFRGSIHITVKSNAVSIQHH
jgi:hypothetical protein